MDEAVRHSIRRIFLSKYPNFALYPASELLGMSFQALKRKIADGEIVAVSTGVGLRVPREEMMAVAFELWPQELIEEALGAEAAAVLPEAIRLVELRARVPRYQRDMLRYFAGRDGTTVDRVLARELEDVARLTRRSWRSRCRGLRGRWSGRDGPMRRMRSPALPMRPHSLK